MKNGGCGGAAFYKGWVRVEGGSDRTSARVFRGIKTGEVKNAHIGV